MKLASLEAIFAALNRADVRYLIVGGVAVNAYGYSRLTQDLDLVIGLSAANVRVALEALRALGYRPSVPVALEEFADAERRRAWIEHKQMQVFSLVSEVHRETTVDLFVTEPFDFEREHAAAEIHELAPGITLPLVRLPSLIAMKRAANRDRDRDDVQHLEWILQEREKGRSDEGG